MSESWLKRFGLHEAGDARDKLVSFLATRVNAGAAQQADRDMLESNIADVVKEKLDAEDALDRRVGNPADPAQAEHMGLRQRLELTQGKKANADRALSVLMQQHDTAKAGDPNANVSGILSQAAHVNSVIDALSHDIERDEHSIAETVEYLGQLQETLKAAREELSHYDEALADAKRDAARAHNDAMLAQQQQQRQERLNGFKGVHTATTAALDSLRVSAEKERKTARVAHEMAEQLKQTAPHSVDDEIAHILAAAPAAPASDPFARLRAKAA